MSWKRYHHRTVDRRSVLKGLGLGAGSLFLSPLLGRIRAEAQGAPPPQRVVFVIKGNGFNWGQRPDRLPQSTEISPLGNLAEEIPVAEFWDPWKPRVHWLEGLTNKQGNGQGAGHRAHYYGLTTRPYAGAGSPSGISIDEHLGRTVGASSVFPVLRLGSEGPGRGLDNVCSAAGPGSPLPTQNDPVEAYKELFGVAADDPELRAAFEEQGLLLDALRVQARRAEQSLQGQDRWKLQRYLHSIESFQIQHRALQAYAPTLQQCAPGVPAVGATEDVGTLFEKQASLAGAALACGLTNVVVLTVGVNSPFEQYADWGFGPAHTMGHGRGATATRPGGGLGLAQTAGEVNRRVADYILRPLEQIQEGDGTMLDNTTIIHLNDNGDSHHSKYDTYPVVMVGDFGGRLQAGGRRVQFPRASSTGVRSLNQLWNTVCYGMGVAKDDFAVDESIPRNHAGPLSELLV